MCVYSFFVLAFYECNLRAYLMSKDFESPIDNFHDLEDSNKPFVLPRGTPYYKYLKTSPFAVQRR